jgi:hypothetical protein
MNSLEKTGAFAHAMNQFEKEVKPNFTADPKRSWFISFPRAKLEDDLDNNLECDILDLK